MKTTTVSILVSLTFVVSNREARGQGSGGTSAGQSATTLAPTVQASATARGLSSSRTEPAELAAGARALIAFATSQLRLVHGSEPSQYDADELALALVASAKAPGAKRVLARWATIGPTYMSQVERARTPYQTYLYARRAADWLIMFKLLPVPVGCADADRVSCVLIAARKGTGAGSAEPTRPPWPAWSNARGWRRVGQSILPIEAADLFESLGPHDVAPLQALLVRDQAFAKALNAKLDADAKSTRAIRTALASSLPALRLMYLASGRPASGLAVGGR